MLCKQAGMDQVESDLAKLLKGAALDENDSLCDFTVADQNEASAAIGVTPLTPSDVVPVTKRTVNYVVLAILINDNDEVLMMQEAKSSCAGQWYLPAGGVEPNENLEEAVKREVLEETGLEMEPSTLLMVESASNSWFRFIFTGTITGGSLKTPAQADCHSLQAKWVSDIKDVNLRAKDVRYVLEVGRMYRAALKQGQPYFSPTLVAINPHKKLLLRLVICVRQRSNNRVHVLLSEKNRLHFPMCEIHGHRNLHSTLRKFMIEIFGASPQPHKPHGILSVEHCGRPEAAHDGFCITILVSFRVPQEQVFPIDKYTWVMVSEELGESVLSKLPRNMSIPLNVIC